MQPIIETLRGFKAFTRIITKGKKYEKKPIKAFVYLLPSDRASLIVGYAVARSVRKAVQRNRFKRLMREAVRLNSQCLINRICAGTKVEIVFLYNNSNEIIPRKIQFLSISQAIIEICSVIEVVKA